MAIAANFPNLKPALNLDFANVGRLDPRVTFTRASTATYYDGVTTAKAEENLLTYSQELDNATGWTAVRASVSANTTTSPDGTSTAESLIEDNTASASHFVQVNTVTAGNFNSVVVNGSTYTFSVFAKANTRSEICLGFFDGSTVHTAFFDLSGGTVLSSSGVTASIVSVGSGWYRCIGIRTNTTTTMALSLQLSVSGSRIYTGDGTSGIYIWGAQLEQRSAVTAYTATTTQPITNYVPVLLTAQNDVSRFQHDPVTGASDGLMFEEQRTNLWLQSEDFSTSWTPTNLSVTTNTVVSPAGTLTGEKLVEDTSASVAHYIAQNTAVTSGVTYTMSVYAKQAESGRYLALRFASGTYFSSEAATFNLSTGAVLNTSGTTTATITSVGNGWYRCSITAVSKATGTPAGAQQILVTNSTSATVFSYTGDGYSGIYIWGAQLEAGAVATSYIPTTTTALTRSADAASMTGTNFSDWFNNAEGTLLVQFTTPNPLINSAPATLNDNTNDNRIGFDTTTTGFGRLIVTTSGVSQVLSGTDGLVAGAVCKMAGAYEFNNFAISKNGGAVSTDTSGTVPTVTQLQIGSRVASFFLNSTIQRIAYYPVRLSNDQLIALTG